MNKLKLYQDSYLNEAREQTDPLADEAVFYLYQHPDWIFQINQFEILPSGEEIKSMPLPLSCFFSAFEELPVWQNDEKVRHAQQFFGQEGNRYLTLLGFYALPYCYAFADGAQVLVRSKRITDDIGMRLTETALFLLDCYRPGTFLDDSKSLLSIAKVRLIHAFSRFFIKKYGKDWNMQWGQPVNQEDMIGTNLAFSLLVMRGMEKLGRFPGKETHEAVLHYWKLIGFYLGINISFWPETAKEAFELEKIIRRRHMRSSDAGRKLVNSLINYYRQAIPDENIAGIVETMMAYFVGEKASEALGISQKVKHPKELYAFTLDLSFFRQYGIVSSYVKTRRIFMEQTKEQFGMEIKLQLPYQKRS
ncbi:oxygenase MpaB family protein [Fontibacter flavus]|uniref:Oxygenase MpaB family protein n=1 Tax=Fontibacter flavus TaxID=654838 RepID=A0ABV6FPA0_9BACT